MGDHILVSTTGKKFSVPSEVVDEKQLTNFVTQNEAGIFVYERSLSSKEEFENLEHGIISALRRLQLEYGTLYRWYDSPLTRGSKKTKKPKSKIQ